MRISCRLYSKHPTGSAKLFADAVKEEAEEKIRRVVVEQQPNWTGDERIEDTVLRMLVDKYKPLRSGTVQTAEQKIHHAAQNHNPQPVVLPSGVSSWSAVPLLPPGPPNHKPWDTVFKAPDVTSPSVRHARISQSDPAPRKDHDRDDLDKAEKEMRKKLGRLSRAKESTLDYRMGLGVNAAHNRQRPNPVSMRGWTNLIEDKIEKARRAGAFASIKGRGRPFERTAAESNPFIGRDEFLINRLIKRNGAAPPWVQLQQELDDAVRTFRLVLLDSWTRHAVRSLPASPTDNDIASLRDYTWASARLSHHTAALNELNNQVRRYNAMAPYAVRRPLHVLDSELRRVYELGPGEVARVLAERKQMRKSRLPEVGRVEMSVDWSWLWRRWLRLREMCMALARRFI
ncbi:hypothetical protein C8F01DRAFT_26229 [Mycena amicta]|nr:hypothetical protein C8F01DRAFT_26229 [Mycena amicta]